MVGPNSRDISAALGIIGLGPMGANLSLNLVDKGYVVATFDSFPEKQLAYSDWGEHDTDRIIRCYSFAHLVAKLQPPRIIILLVKAGKPVDQHLDELIPLLSTGDILIDAGNSNFKQTDLRIRRLKEVKVRYLGLGVSGGEKGARHGLAIMAGGDESAYHHVSPILSNVAAKTELRDCLGFVGDGGAGHFAKIVHNGIEYGLMQLIAEAYFIMNKGLGLSHEEMASAFRSWRDAELGSYLIEITSEILERVDPGTGAPLVELISDKAEQKGTGRWCAIAGLELGVAIPTICEAVHARVLSSQREEGQQRAMLSQHGKIELRPSERPNVTKEQLGEALLAAMILTYAQGFALLASYRTQQGSALPLQLLAEIWQGGCIIRAKFLTDIAEAFSQDQSLNHILWDQNVTQKVSTNAVSLRQVVSQTTLFNLPIPALSASLAYFDSWHAQTLWTNLVQAQRDYFGAHGYRRIDRPGLWHTIWSEPTVPTHKME